MARRRQPSPSSPASGAADARLIRLADRLHSSAIHLLRRLRAHDAQAGLTGPRLSALSVVVFAGPLPLTALAEAEQVRLPTMSRMIAELERLGLVERVADPSDGRARLVRATARGDALLRAGQRRRITALTERLAALPAGDRRALERAADVLARLALPADHPARE